MHYYLTCTHAWIHKETNKVIKHAVVVRLLKSFYHPLTGFRWFCQTKLFQERPSESPIDPQGKKSYSTNVAKEGGCVVSGNNIIFGSCRKDFVVERHRKGDTDSASEARIANKQGLFITPTKTHSR